MSLPVQRRVCRRMYKSNRVCGKCGNILFITNLTRSLWCPQCRCYAVRRGFEQDAGQEDLPHFSKMFC